MKPHKSFGDFFKEKRIEKGLTLRQFCCMNGLNAGNISKMERGLMPPPQSNDILERYASFLGISQGSDDWYEFLDLAAASVGSIPQYLMDNREVVKKLPLFFRTLRGDKITKAKLEELIELIRKS